MTVITERVANPLRRRHTQRRSTVFMAIGTFAIAGLIATWATLGKPGGLIPGLILAGLIGALGLYLLFVAVRFKIRGNPSEGSPPDNQ